MKVSIQGTGSVGQTLAKAFLKEGHEVTIGSRNPERPELKEYLDENSEIACMSNSDSARDAEIVVMAVQGRVVESAIEEIGKENLEGRVIIDATNDLVWEDENKPPKPGRSYPESIGKMIQEIVPTAKVVKAFNIIVASKMYKPSYGEGTPAMFICGDDEAAKDMVREILKAFGWTEIHDLGGIDQSYLLEGLAMLWIKFAFDNQKWDHGFALLMD